MLVGHADLRQAGALVEGLEGLGQVEGVGLGRLGLRIRHVLLDGLGSVEDVDVWSDTGAITETAREGIRAVYRTATPEFAKLHAVSVGDKIVDHMLFGVAVGTK